MRGFEKWSWEFWKIDFFLRISLGNILSFDVLSENLKKYENYFNFFKFVLKYFEFWHFEWNLKKKWKLFFLIRLEMF